MGDKVTWNEHLETETLTLLEKFTADLRQDYGASWGLVLDVRDNIAQLVRCVFSDTRGSGLQPMASVPLVPDLSWRVTAMESERPFFFETVDSNDPRSFYLNKRVGPQQIAFFPIREDINLGVLTIFTHKAGTKTLREADVHKIHRRCQALIPQFHRFIWKIEQASLNQALADNRQREAPVFICQLFSRLLESPCLFLERMSDGGFRVLHREGTLRQPAVGSSVHLHTPIEGTIHKGVWSDWSSDEIFSAQQPVVHIRFGKGDHVVLCMGHLDVPPKTIEHFHYYVDKVEHLLNRPNEQISTLNFLLHLQHWIRSGERNSQEVFQFIIETLVPYLGADFGTLALLNPDKQKLILVSQAGAIVNPLKTLPIEDGEQTDPTSILSWVARNERPFLASDVRQVEFYKAFDPDIRAEMCAPIRVRGDLIGIFSISSKTPHRFAAQDLSKLNFFCDQIGIALFQAGILDRVLMENDQLRKSEQESKFGVAQHTHAKDLIYTYGNLVGDSSGSMGAVYGAIERINQSGREDLNVLITGETGTGKEMVAFALHNSSRRAKRPMVITNFASLGGDPNLIQSELFGHEKGAFSGATQRRVGALEQANGSTLLIDEVGDIVHAVQIKLLRVLQQGAEKTFQRLGGQTTVNSNLRILAATHRDLWQAVKAGSFREDLYFRLRTLVIRVPPLRERAEDIPLLAAHFAAKCERAVPGSQLHWGQGAIAVLQAYDWPGNVRQLEAVINRASVMYADDGLMTRDAILQSLAAENAAPSQSLFDRVRQAGDNAFWQDVWEPFRGHRITKQDLLTLVEDALTASKGSYKQAARMMGVADEDYRRFLDFLKNSDAKPDFRKFRDP